MAFTRAASASSSHRAKQELVKLLFGPKYYRKGPEAHRMLDHSIYTHAELRSAYLQRIQELHPDKRRNQSSALYNEFSNTEEKKQPPSSEEFISLQDAWRRYEEFAKVLAKVDNGSRDSDFTLFGVGCSFSDNDAERDMRNEITDQACKGWFAAGHIGEGKAVPDANSKSFLRNGSSLLDDDMFTEGEKDETPAQSVKPARKSLIDHMVRQKR